MSTAASWSSVRYQAPPMAYSNGMTKSLSSECNGDMSGFPARLSTTNVYIRGLKPTIRDTDLVETCRPYGSIKSTKAIVDRATGLCKGYGFVEFQSADSADRAVKGLQDRGLQAQMAKETPPKAKTQTTTVQPEQDPTNLYIANLPLQWTENDLETHFGQFGAVISTRVLRTPNGDSRGVGFVRMESREKCELIIERFNNKPVQTGCAPLLLKFADSNKNRLRPLPGGVGDAELAKAHQRKLVGASTASMHPLALALAGYNPQPNQMTQAYIPMATQYPTAQLYQAPPHSHGGGPAIGFSNSTAPTASTMEQLSVGVQQLQLQAPPQGHMPYNSYQHPALLYNQQQQMYQQQVKMHDGANHYESAAEYGH